MKRESGPARPEWRQTGEQSFFIWRDCSYGCLGAMRLHCEIFKLGHYFWQHLVFTAAHRLSLVAASGGYSPVVECGLLTAAASLVAAWALSGGAPVVVMHWLRCLCGIFLDKGSNQCPLHWQVDS